MRETTLRLAGGRRQGRVGLKTTRPVVTDYAFDLFLHAPLRPASSLTPGGHGLRDERRNCGPLLHDHWYRKFVLPLIAGGNCLAYQFVDCFVMVGELCPASSGTMQPRQPLRRSGVKRRNV